MIKLHHQFKAFVSWNTEYAQQIVAIMLLVEEVDYLFMYSWLLRINFIISLFGACL